MVTLFLMEFMTKTNKIYEERNKIYPYPKERGK